jgi:hypothetical protein
MGLRWVLGLMAVALAANGGLRRVAARADCEGARH